MTRRCGERLSRLMTASAISSPTAKCSGSLLRATKGMTAMPGSRAAGCSATGVSTGWLLALPTRHTRTGSGTCLR